ncbi:FAD-dependent oxidoreductase [Halobaculum sp. MBLA0147]|uniref:FAD-dependent oxidoreductase n=1 Tax=Halobaculum sp. MBLA0147 TaxID=3079934 RepID=UPI003526725D
MEFTTSVAGVERVGPETVALTLESPADFVAEPGQFVRFTAEIDGEEVSRFYTVSSPDTDETFETTVGLDGGDDEGPDFASYLANLEPGAELDAAGPFGDEFYEGEARAVVLAGGPGVGPAVAIGERALAEGNDVAIVYQDDAPAHEARLDALRERGAHVTVTDGPIGAVTADVVTEADGEQAFVYGFADFVAEAESALETAGIHRARIKTENFG